MIHMGATRLCFVLFCFNFVSLKAADPNPQLKLYADSLRYSPIESVRQKYNDSFIVLIKSLAEEDSGYDMNLDSISTIVSVLNSEDGKMKVISWVFVTDLEQYQNHCLVLYRSKIGKPHKSYWLKDFIEPQSDSLYEDFTVDFWPGALYYQMYEFKKKGKTYYCLLGLDGKNSFSNRKVIEVFWVDKEEELHIGAPVFYSSERDYTPQYRVFFEYANESTMILRFEKTDKLITFSNLVPSNPEKMGMYQYYIPDGRIDFYKLKRKGKWIRYTSLEEFNFPGNE
ncbi:MAG: hypothetical protein IT245_08855 [Bacteroidia bacterium]|nr:hypothetical protein [Bacteroidia bacterium]